MSVDSPLESAEIAVSVMDDSVSSSLPLATD